MWGGKTANVVLNMWWQYPAQAVDTHIFRFGNRSGVCPGKDVVAVERAIEDNIPVDFQQHAHHWMILHGRYTCVARKTQMRRLPDPRSVHVRGQEPVRRRNVSSGSPLEPQIGFSRAVRIGSHVAVAGTAPIAEGGGTEGVGDVAAQTRRCLEIGIAALAEAGAAAKDVIRSRIMLTDIGRWQEAAHVHGEVFGDIRPVCTFVEVSGFIDPDWLVETELDAVVTKENP